jgi:hypothetical protein
MKMKLSRGWERREKERARGKERESDPLESGPVYSDDWSVLHE